MSLKRPARVVRINKGQIAGQVLVYILGLVVIAAVVLFGLYVAQKLRLDTDRISLAKFQTRLHDRIDKVGYGDRTHVDFTLPKGFSKLCFIDVKMSPTPDMGICKPGDVDHEPVICRLWEQGTRDNVVLVGKEIEPFFVGYDNEPGFILDSGYLCHRGPRLSIQMDGQGKAVKLS